MLDYKYTALYDTSDNNNFHNLNVKEKFEN
jgi:hypothetical protein